jgi:TolA-binding protein
VNNDLNRSFNMPVNYSGWQKIGIDFLITGSINIQGNKLSFKYRLFDILHEKPFGKIINFDTKVQSLDAITNQASDNIKKQFSEHLNSSNRRDTIKIIQEELLKAGCKIGMADGVIGTRTRIALKEITQKLKINYSDSLASTPSYMFNLLKIIKSTDVSKYWCTSDSSELQNYEEGMQLLFKNDFSLAILKLGKFIEASSNTEMLAKAHYYIGDAFTGLKDWKLALKSYLKSFELDTDGDYAAKALKASYLTALMPLNENNFELAIIQFDTLINVIPNGPLLTAAHYSKGDALSELGDWKSAGQSYLESFRLEPDGKYAAKALMNVGVSLGKMQKINEACNILSRVEPRFPESEVVKEAKYEMQLFGCS